MKGNNPVVLLLRLGLATVFFYAAIASFLDPNSWVGYFPPFLIQIFPAQALLLVFSVYQLVLTLWLLVGWKTFFVAIISTFTFVAIIGPNLSQADVIFRDVGLLFAALALAAATYPFPKK